MSWIEYQNGNYTVRLNTEDGTKIRVNDLDFFEAEFPESADVKITNRCRNSCAFCHENSTCDGKHGNILNNPVIHSFHPYSEMAIGGGNPLEHPNLVEFLKEIATIPLIPSMTIRQNDFMDNLPLLRMLRDEKLIYGIGISLVNPNQEGFIEAVKEFPNTVIHVINGIVSMPELDALAGNGLKILILGYKEVRRGANLYNSSEEERNHINNRKQDLYTYLPEIIERNWFDVVSFDNLAIKQLQPQRLMSQEKWDEMYMGDDNIDGKLTSASMFVDLVEQKFSANSCSPESERFKLKNNITDMYKFLCERYNR